VVVMTIPGNVSRFEMLMYLSLLVIVVSGVLFEGGEFADTVAGAAGFAGAVLLMIVTWWFIIRLAARKRMNWARWFRRPVFRVHGRRQSVVQASTVR
jgi:F0F1-type ATP synthase assembly protein I